MKCVYLFSASSQRAHPENGSLAVFFFCHVLEAQIPGGSRMRTDSFREFRMRESSHACGLLSCTIPKFLSCIFLENKKQSCMHYCCTAARNIIIAPAAYSFCGYIRYAQTCVTARLGERQGGGWEWSLSAFCSSGVSFGFFWRQEEPLVMSIQWQMVRTKAGAHCSAGKIIATIYQCSGPCLVSEMNQSYIVWEAPTIGIPLVLHWLFKHTQTFPQAARLVSDLYTVYYRWRKVEAHTETSRESRFFSSSHTGCIMKWNEKAFLFYPLGMFSFTCAHFFGDASL